MDSSSPPHRPLGTPAPAHPLRRAVRAAGHSCRRAARAAARAGRAITGATGRAPRGWPRFASPARKGRRLVVDCEAFVTGRYPARLPRRGRWEWAWINTLAHADRDALEHLARQRRRGRRAQAASFAAGEVLSLADRCGGDLGWLQRAYLVPLELRCMRGMVRTSASTTAAVLEALRQARRAAFPLPPERERRPLN